MTKCDKCQKEINNPACVKVKYTGGAGIMWLVCKECAQKIEFLIITFTVKKY